MKRKSALAMGCLYRDWRLARTNRLLLGTISGISHLAAAAGSALLSLITVRPIPRFGRTKHEREGLLAPNGDLTKIDLATVSKTIGQGMSSAVTDRGKSA